jgi:ribonuclease VapC
MVIDTSALVAILLEEAEAVAFVETIRGDLVRLFSAVSLLEAIMVMESRRGAEGRIELESVLREFRVEVRAFDLDQARRAAEAWQEFGKGRHAAALNLGDCATYALVRASGERLLCKGNDFAQTDIAHLILR